MITNEPHPGTRPRPDGTRAPLVCPECGEPARAVPPREWPLAGWAPRPRFSHHDGTPLCPIIGPDGYTPAEPTRAAASGAPPAATRPVDNATPDRAVRTASTSTAATATVSPSTDDTSAHPADTARHDDGDRCRTEGCPGDPNDGDSHDGYRASCADRHEAAGTWQ